MTASTNFNVQTNDRVELSNKPLQRSVAYGARRSTATTVGNLWETNVS